MPAHELEKDQSPLNGGGSMHTGISSHQALHDDFPQARCTTCVGRTMNPSDETDPSDSNRLSHMIEIAARIVELLRDNRR